MTIRYSGGYRPNARINVDFVPAFLYDGSVEYTIIDPSAVNMFVATNAVHINILVQVTRRFFHDENGEYIEQKRDSEYIYEVMPLEEMTMPIDTLCSIP